jgi:hypothetical protein
LEASVARVALAGIQQLNVIEREMRIEKDAALVNAL